MEVANDTLVHVWKWWWPTNAKDSSGSRSRAAAEQQQMRCSLSSGCRWVQHTMAQRMASVLQSSRTPCLQQPPFSVDSAWQCAHCLYAMPRYRKPDHGFFRLNAGSAASGSRGRTSRRDSFLSWSASQSRSADLRLHISYHQQHIPKLVTRPSTPQLCGDIHHRVALCAHCRASGRCCHRRGT